MKIFNSDKFSNFKSPQTFNEDDYKVSKILVHPVLYSVKQIHARTPVLFVIETL